MGGAEQTESGEDSEDDGPTRSWSNSEAMTRKRVKQKPVAEPSFMVAEFNHLHTARREPATG
jgi:hypothetical protein